MGVFMKKVMIIMSERTGTGHKSAANAITKKLEPLGYVVEQLDAFPLMGRKGVWMEDVYIPLTIKAPNIYYASYKFEQSFPNSIHSTMKRYMKKAFLKKLEELKPDIIITVHSMFTKAVSDILKKSNMSIPLYVAVVDLVKPPAVWFNKDATMTFVPTEEIKEDYIKKGMPEEKIIVYGFPTRDDIVTRKEPKEIKNKTNILLVNPSVYLKKNIKYVKEVSRIENANIDVICGRDENLYKKLTKMQEEGQISKDVKIHSFVTNMHEFLNNSHIILTKAGPNMMIEALKSVTAVVVTGHIKRTREPQL
jgi:processive 1,2-diacylglycerol beta-glucosyltransferase